MFRSSPTFDDIIRASPEHCTGFDYLRVGLALAVVVVHCMFIGSPPQWEWLWTSWFGPIERFILPSFFALSGYLVAGSLFRNTIPQFLMLRVARIFPALAVEVVLSAIVLGGLATTLPLAAYLASPQFHAYFLNMLGIIHFTLPGVFENKTLNVQLWTIPFELECYVALVALAMFGLVRRPRLFLGVVVAGILLMTAVAIRQDWYDVNWNVPGRMLVVSFLCGCLAYLFRTRLRHSKVALLIAVAATYVFLNVPNLVLLAALPLTYVTAYIGLLRLPKIPFGDISYGVYLFHFPIARTIHEVSGQSMAWPLLLALTLLLTAIFAMGSWRLIEKPVLGRKRQLLAMTDAVSARVARAFSFRRPSTS